MWFQGEGVPGSVSVRPDCQGKALSMGVTGPTKILKRSLWALSSTSPVTLGESSLTGLQLLYVSSGAGPLYSVRLLTVVEFGLVAEQAVPSVLSLLSSIWLPKRAKSHPSTLSLLCGGGPQPLLLALK